MRGDLCLREWRYEDNLAVAALERRCFSDPWNYKSFADSFLSGIFHGVIAEEDGEIVGYGFYTCMFEDAEIDRIAVDPDERRRGTGGKILKELLRSAKGLGAERMLLEVRASNEGAIALYRGAGFQKIAERAKYYGDGETAWVLEKKPL